MPRQRHRKNYVPSKPDGVDDDSGKDGDDDSSPSSPNTDFVNLTNVPERKLLLSKENLYKKVVGTRDSKDKELVRLLEPQEDEYDEDVNINLTSHKKVNANRKKVQMGKITEDKIYVTEDKENLPKDKKKVTEVKQNFAKNKYTASEEKYDADVDTQTSNEDVKLSQKNVTSTGKKILKSERMASGKPLQRTEKRTSQWEELMRKFSEAHKEECKTVSLDIPRAPRTAKHFPTGSQYEGTWDILGMSGFGTYTFPNGVIYVGEFDDGMFHGVGELRYPEGAILRGTWKKGLMTERTLLFGDGLEYKEKDWMYCKIPDRRFTIEYKNGVQPAGMTYQTADQPTRVIPTGFYDTGDGFYDPVTKMVYHADDINSIIRSPEVAEQKWIVANCRYAQDDTQGPRPDLYEQWSEPKVDPESSPPPASQTRYREKTGAPHDWVVTPEEPKLYPQPCPDASDTSSSSCDESCAKSCETLFRHV